ncbi:hypothetical protein [Luteimonas vadosa]|uniref:helix-turn-helix transcriptional regulator n=1 Tax=Luteimonas vadosa TaxID=1165507 RepID=UPI0031ECF9C2
MTDPASQPPRPGERRQHREQRADQLRWIAQARSFGATLDRLPQALMLVVPGRPIRVWYANAAARQRFSEPGPLRLRQDLLLVGDDATALHGALRRAGTAIAAHRERIDLPGADGVAGLQLHVEALDFGASADLPVSQVVLIEAHAPLPDTVPLERLCREFGLTPGEAGAAVRLLATGSLEQIARDTGRSIHTVRTQIKGAMVKTGTHSQAALVGLVSRRLSA